MPRITEHLWIDAPAEEVFSLLSDIGRATEYQPHWKEARAMSGAKGQVGSTAHLVIDQPAAGRMEMDLEVIELKQNEKLAFRTTAGNVTAFGSYTLERSHGGTELRFEAEYALPYSILGRIIDALGVGKAIRKDTQEGLVNLKRILEK